MPEDWDRAVAVVAHPDDLEYGMASAVARWTGQGKQVSYLLATKGEAGIAGMPPAEVAPLPTSSSPVPSEGIILAAESKRMSLTLRPSAAK